MDYRVSQKFLVDRNVHISLAVGMRFKKITLLAYLLITSHIFAWQPSGWVYQMGDYQYEFESGDWYWKMDWDYWNVNLSTGNWTNSSANGWNYYTWPYFYSTSLGQWRYASDPGSGADIVNLSTSSWSKFGQETQTAYALNNLEAGTLVLVDSSENYSLGLDDSIVFIGRSGNYLEIAEDLSWVDIGIINYNKTGANAGTISQSYYGYVLYYGLQNYPDRSYSVNFISENRVTTSAGAILEIQAAQDYAPTSLSGRTAFTNGFSYQTGEGTGVSSGSLVFNNSFSGTFYSTENVSIVYSYDKIGPREASMNVAGSVPNYGTFNASYTINFLTETRGYYLSEISYSNGASVVSWGTFTLQ